MAKLLTDPGLCTGCGICAGLCPFGCMTMEDGQPSAGEGCTLCGECVRGCPQGALAIRRQGTEEDTRGWEGILVLLQQHNGNVHPVSYELAGKALELAGQRGCKVHGLLIGEDAGRLVAEFSGCGLSGIYLFDHPFYRHFRADAYGEAACRCIDALRPSVFLLGATPEGRSMAPFVSVAFSTGLTADCTALSLTPAGGLVQVRPAFGGNVMAQIVTPSARPQIATVRYGVFEPVQPCRHGTPPKVIACPLPPLRSRVQVLEDLPLDEGRDITSARILVAIGNGVRSKEDIPALERLAASIGGQLASARSLVEKGWMPPERQIGLSGRAVRPDLLLTLGISGSVQFLAGITGARYLCAVNSDPAAPILARADLPLVGDLYEVLPQLTELLSPCES